MSWPRAFRVGTQPFDPTHRFETSWLLPPWLLFACRALMALYIFFTLFFIIGYTCAHDSLGGCESVRRSFSYFTDLAFWGLGFYFLFAAVHTLRFAVWGSGLHGFPRPLQALHSLLYTTVVTLPFLVTIVYWGLLYRSWFEHTFNAWHNISQHALNSAFALFEVFVARTDPMPWLHLLWLIVILLGYLAVAYITVADQGWYTYNFLDWEAVNGRGYVAAYIFGIAAGFIVVFLVVWLLIWLRRRLTEGRMGMDMDGGSVAREQSRQRDVEAHAEADKATQ